MPQKYECVFILHFFVTNWAWKFKNIKGTSFICTHTIYKDALLFCINIWHYVLKEYLWFLIWIIILFKLADLHESWMVPLTISCDGFPVWNLICNESLWLIMKGVFYCLITTHVQSSLKVYQLLFFKHIALKHMHTYIYTQVCKN